MCFLFHFYVYVSVIYDYIMLSRIGTSYDGHCPSSCLLLLRINFSLSRSLLVRMSGVSRACYEDATRKLLP